MKNPISLSLLLVGAGIAGSFTALPAQAFSFSTSGIEVEGTLDLTFTAAIGRFQSSLNLYKLDTAGAPQLVIADIFRETGPGISSTVTPTEAAITLNTGIYTFGITIPNRNYGGFNGSNGFSRDVVFSTTALNNGIFSNRTSQQAVFGLANNINIAGATGTGIGQKDGTAFASLNPGGAGNFTGSSLTAQDLATGIIIGFDDTGASQDSDYNDFVFQVQSRDHTGVQPVPEPTTMAGLFLAGAGLLYGRKKLKVTSER